MPSHTILLVDDSPTVRSLTGRLVERAGYRCITACDGHAALEICRQQRPDLILMDIMMPGMDGMEATARLRALFGDVWVPIIFMTSHQEMEWMVAALKSGGDDYLLKPLHYELLSAKIGVFLHIADMQKQITQDTRRLAKYYADNQSEQELALEVLNRLSHRTSLSAAHVWHHLRPAEHFSGDFICRRILSGNFEHFLLADCTGHGLTAAISALPAIDSFYELAPKYRSASGLACGINKKLHSVLPTGRFIAAAVASIDYAEHTLSVFNGGMPCVLLYGADGQLRRGMAAQTPPLGILDQAEFAAAQTQRVSHWFHGEVLILCSDGITEADNRDGVMFGVDGVKSAVGQGWPDNIGPSILAALESHVQGREASDDMSLLVLRLHDNALAPEDGRDEAADRR